MLKNEIRKKSPRNLLLIFEVLALFLLFVGQGENIDRGTLATAIGLVLIIYISNFILSKVSTGDNYIFLIVTMLISIGAIMIYRIDATLGYKQLIWISLGIILFYMTYFIMKYLKQLEDWSYIYLGLSYLLFLLTFILGSRRGGAINWIDIKGFTFHLQR